MVKKLILLVAVSTPILLGALSCNKASTDSNEAEMYEASELSELMRTMVEYSKATKKALEAGEAAPAIPESLWTLREAEATRGEHEEEAFQAMTGPYLEALKGIERGDSQAYFYARSIDACIACHSSYCGGPMSIIQKLKP